MSRRLMKFLNICVDCQVDNYKDDYHYSRPLWMKDVMERMSTRIVAFVENLAVYMAVVFVYVVMAVKAMFDQILTQMKMTSIQLTL